jgi:hypothetical protein
MILKSFSFPQKMVCIVKDVDSLFGAMGHVYNPEEWWTFIDSSKVSLKAVLLHTGNIYPSVPRAYSVHMKESHESMRVLFICIDYDKCKWKICGDLKVLGLSLGIQKDYIKYCCFLCERNSHDKKHHYARKHWPQRRTFTPAKMSISCEPLVNPRDIFPPPPFAY